MRIGIVGAGCSGLACLKELREVGLDAVAFEAAPAIGGVYARTYEGCRLTTSSLSTAFSDFSDGGEATPVMWTARQYLDYLEAYATAFGLWPHLRLARRVERIRPAGSGRWRVEVTGGAGGHPEELEFDRVAICSGTHRVPHRPTWPGMEYFAGKILHAADYRRPEEFAGRRVVIVGAGESASDIALEVARVAAASCLVTRGRFGHIVPRVVGGLPSDLDTSRAHHSLPRRLAPFIGRYRMLGLAAIGLATGSRVLVATARINLRERTHGFNRFGTKTTGMVEALVEHGCSLRPAIARFLTGGVELADGSAFPCDAVICATGYRHRFEFLEQDLPAVARDAMTPRRLYKRCVHPAVGPGLFWSGFARPAFGAIPPMSELQARWFALLASGRRSLPEAAAMAATIAADDVQDRSQFGDDLADQLPALTDFLIYLDDLAAIIGCRPELGRLLRHSPRLWFKALWGPIVGAQYRLTGPGAKPQLAAQILSRLPWSPQTAADVLLLGACAVLHRLGARRFAAKGAGRYPVAARSSAGRPSERSGS